MFRLSSLHPRRVALGLLALLSVGLLLLQRATAETPSEPKPAESSLKRRDVYSPEYLKYQLGQVPELDINKAQTEEFRVAMADLVGEMKARASYSNATRTSGPDPSSALLDKCFEHQSKAWITLGLPAREKKAALLAAEAAESLEETASLLRRRQAVTLPNRGNGKESPPLVQTIRQLATALQIEDPAKVPARFGPALVQLLQSEDEPSRLLLVEALDRMNGSAASVALAQRALYDVSLKVREAALKALDKRPREEGRQLLLDGLRYPWPCVADHAAEALVALRDTAALPALKKLVDEPDPSAPFLAATPDRKPTVREVVRVNHLRNCMTCHAPSLGGKDLVAAPIPVPGEPLPFEYYGSRNNRGSNPLVRADTTYLRQDFSVTQTVEKAAPWPAQQRFDFLVRTRPATPEELEAAKKPLDTYPQREAVRWAIAELEKETR